MAVAYYEMSNPKRQGKILRLVCAFFSCTGTQIKLTGNKKNNKK